MIRELKLIQGPSNDHECGSAALTCYSFPHAHYLADLSIEHICKVSKNYELHDFQTKLF